MEGGGCGWRGGGMVGERVDKGGMRDEGRGTREGVELIDIPTSR